MKKFEPVRKSIEDVFSRSYELPYYQREYTWGTMQIQDLIDDFVTEFSESYQEGDDETKVHGYGYYYIGSIIVDADGNLVDGQQRLSSISLLLIYLYHRLQAVNIELAIKLKGFVYQKRLGEAHAMFTISAPDRFEMMEAILNETEYPSDVSESADCLRHRYEDICLLFPNMSDSELAVFSTWLATNVQLIAITADNGTDAYRIFSTQNDRGKPLDKMDMLKADILSHIDKEYQEECNEQWKGIIASLHESGLNEFKKNISEEESVMGMMLNSYYATEIVTHKELTGTPRRSAIESDFARSRNNPYKWAISNKNKMSLETSDDYRRFIDVFQRYAEMYVFIRRTITAEHCPKGLENLYHLPKQYVSALFISLMLAPMSVSQSRDDTKEQINLIARFLDIFVAKYCFKKWGITSESNYDFLFQRLIKKIRGKSLLEIKYYLGQFITERGYAIHNYTDDIQQLEFPEGRRNKRYKELKWILARITAYLEVLCGSADLTHAYQTEDYHIEHIIPNHPESWPQYGFANIEEFSPYRNNIASLLILKGEVNSGLGDRPFAEKKEAYSSPNGNQYASSLSFDEAYMHSSLKKLVKSGVPFMSFETFDKDAIANRKTVVTELCKRIWNTDDFVLSSDEKRYLVEKCGIDLDDTIIDAQDDMSMLNVTDNNEVEDLETIWREQPCPSGEYQIESKDKSVMMTVRVEEYDDGSKGFIIKNDSLVAPRKKAWRDDPIASGLYATIRDEAEKLGVVATNYKLKTDVVFTSPSAAESFGYGSSHDGKAFQVAYYNGNYTPLTDDFPSGGTKGLDNYCDYDSYIEIEKLLADPMGVYRDVYTKRQDSYANIYAGKGMKLIASIEPSNNSVDIWFYIPIDSFDCYGEELKDYGEADISSRHINGKTRLRIPENAGSPIPLFEKYFDQVLAHTRQL